MAKLLSVASVRALLGKLGIGSDLAPTGATNASPSVIAKTAHGLSVGDVVAQWGFATNTAVNGVFVVGTVPDADHYTLTDFSGTAINGNGASGAGHAVRVFNAMQPEDVGDLETTLSRASFARGSDANRTASSTIQSIFGA